MDLKLGALSKDFTSAQEDLIKMTAKIEASGAIAQSLTEELAENSAKIHQLQNENSINTQKVGIFFCTNYLFVLVMRG